MSVGPLGFGDSEWKQIVMGRAQRVVSTKLRRIITNDFDTDALAASFTNTSGTVAYDTGLSGGVARLRGGILGLAIAGVKNAGGAALVGNPLTQSWYAHSRVWIRDAPLANFLGSTFYAAIGMQDTAGSGQFVMLGMDASISTTNLILRQVVSGGGGTTDIDTGVAADLTGFRDYGIGRDVGGDRLFALLDDDVIEELTGPFANLTALPSQFYSSMQTAFVGQDAQIWVDELATAVERAG